MTLKNNPRAYAIMGCAMRVHATLGCGFLESAYGDALEIEFQHNGIPYKREDEIKIFYEGIPLKTTYRADFTCYDRSVIVELKAIKNLTSIEWAQVRHYMKATNTPYGLLINFARPELQYDTFDLSTLKPRNVSGASDKSEFQHNAGESNSDSSEAALTLRHSQRTRNVSGASDKSEFQGCWLLKHC